jgi:predicted PurR-regulated permease PerM
MKRLARVTATILLTMGLVVLLWMFSSAVLLFIMSLVIAGSVRPLAIRLMERRIPRAASYALIYVLVFAVLGSLITVTASGLLDELQRAGDHLLQTYTSIKLRWPQGAEWQQRIVTELPSREDLLSALAGDQGATIAKGVVGFGSGIFDLVAQLVIVLSLSIYWSIDQEHFERLWLSLVSAKYRSRARTIWRSVEREVGAYMRSEVAQGCWRRLRSGWPLMLSACRIQPCCRVGRPGLADSLGRGGAGADPGDAGRPAFRASRCGAGRRRNDRGVCRPRGLG